MSLLPALSLGFAVGLAHAADADHVAAMSTVVAERRRVSAAARAGALWGVGHALTILLVGGGLVATRSMVPERIALALELGVAVMLVVLGLRALSARATHAPAASRSGWKSLGIGFVHGLAGSAAVALVVASSIEETSEAFAYLGFFGLGTVAGMVLLTSLLAVPFALASKRFGSRAARGVRGVAGVASAALGAWLFYKIGFLDGLFV